MSDRFYVLTPFRNERFGRAFAHANMVQPVVVGEPEDRSKCPICGEGLGQLEWLPPRRVRLSSGRYPDVLSGDGFKVAFSDRAYNISKGVGLRVGRIPQPSLEVISVGKRSDQQLLSSCPSYYLVEPTIGAAQLDDDASHAKRSPTQCTYCRQGIDSLTGVYLIEGSWTGEDLFVAFGLPGTYIASERFFQAFVREGLKGFDLVPAEEFTISWNMVS